MAIKKLEGVKKLYVNYDSASMDIDDGRDYSDEEWDRPDTETDHFVYGVSLKGKEYDDFVPVDENVKAGDTVFLVYAVWTTGDSFGTDYNGSISFIIANMDLDIANHNRDVLLNHEGFGKVTLLTDDRKEYTAYAGYWNGYFEELTDVYVKQFTVKGV